MVNDENYGAHYLDNDIGYLDYLDHAWNAFRPLDGKNYGAHHLDSIIGYLDYV